MHLEKCRNSQPASSADACICGESIPKADALIRVTRETRSNKGQLIRLLLSPARYKFCVPIPPAGYLLVSITNFFRYAEHLSGNIWQ